MKGDFSRNSFDRRKKYSRVLMQMGRVLTDSDWNELNDTVLHALRALAADIFGPHGGPTDNLGFEVVPKPSADGRTLEDLYLRPGRYYVGGILCEQDQPVDMSKKTGPRYYEQPYFPLGSQELRDRYKLPEPMSAPFIVYLDVWERLVTGVEDPSLIEVALGGPDTTVRTQVVWQVRFLPLGDTVLEEVTCENVQSTRAWQEALVLPSKRRGRLRVKAQEPQPADIGDPCNISPDARYRGNENQLYRVEIHHGGPTADATFKFSRDNGSDVFSVLSVAGQTVTLASLGRDPSLGLRAGDWVELSDDYSVLRNGSTPLLEVPPPLLEVEEVDAASMTVRLKTAPAGTVGHDQSAHPLLRRWDQREGDTRTGGLKLRDGAAVVVEQAGEDAGWLTLEDGIQIKFEQGATYRTGDYWVFAARTATGDVVWPRETGGKPAALPPHGVEHYYAPLANVYGGQGVMAVWDLRRALDAAACRHVPLSDGSTCPAARITSYPNGDGTLQFVAEKVGGNPSLIPTWTWEDPKPATLVTGAGTNSIKVKPPAAGTSFVVKVTGTNFPNTCRKMATMFVPNTA